LLGFEQIDLDGFPSKSFGAHRNPHLQQQTKLCISIVAILTCLRQSTICQSEKNTTVGARARVAAALARLVRASDNVAAMRIASAI
jgi:hypothetical protein